MMEKKVANLVADSGAFILRSPLHEYAEKVFTLTDVINEIKDEKTRESLQVLPYELNLREPSEEDVKFVAHFAKRTGDFAQLSVTDIRLLALVVRLEKEINNGVNLKSAPAIPKLLPTKPASQDKDATIRDMQLFGYDLTTRTAKVSVTDEIGNESSSDHIMEERSNGDDEITNNGEKINDDQDAELKEESNEERVNDKLNEQTTDSTSEKIMQEESILIGDDEGWITKDNCEEIRQKLMGLKVDEEEEETQLTVACVTGDYAMQNILLQMGLNVISPRDGLHIRRTRQFVLRCFACFRINSNTTTQFCKFCGNKTLKRVSVTINDDGSTKVHINFRKPINIRGTKYALPTPRGGKHASNPILCADQQMPQQRKSKLVAEEKKRLTVDAIMNDPAYLVRTNPFQVNDVYSRASRHSAGVTQRKTLNPNETRKPTGNRKKKNRHH